MFEEIQGLSLRLVSHYAHLQFLKGVFLDILTKPKACITYSLAILTLNGYLPRP